jgi:ribosomal protein S14
VTYQVNARRRFDACRICGARTPLVTYYAGLCGECFRAEAARLMDERRQKEKQK